MDWLDSSPKWLEKNEEEKGRFITYIDELIRTSTITERQKTYYEDRLFEMTWGELEEVTDFLKENQMKNLDEQFKEATK